MNGESKSPSGSLMMSFTVGSRLTTSRSASTLSFRTALRMRFTDVDMLFFLSRIAGPVHDAYVFPDVPESPPGRQRMCSERAIKRLGGGTFNVDRHAHSLC